MKTNVIMSRPMGDFVVHQRTKDGFFNATSLLEQWNTTARRTKTLKVRTLDNFWKSTHLSELMTEIAENELGFKSVDFTELKSVLSNTRRGRVNSGTWMHPYLFIKFAMYLAPKFEYSVIKFVYDELIKHRHTAGDNYKRLTAAAAKLKNVSYPEIAKALNYTVFGRHHKDIRNNATPEQLADLQELENQMAFAIDMNYITTFDQLIDSLRTIWYKRNRKF